MILRHRLLVATVLAAGTACKSPSPEGHATDSREPLALPLEAQYAIRAEMNGMLASLNRILVALPPDDTAAIRAAALASGLATAADPALEKLLPEQFITWGTQTHQAFDRLATTVTSTYVRDSVLGQLGTITQLCVTCHARYRLAAR